MARQSFRPAGRDRNYSHELATDNLPERASVDLDDEDPNNLTVVEVDDTPEEDRGRPTELEYSIADQEDNLRGITAKTQKRIDRLKFETNTERRAREAAERERDAAVEAARLAREEVERLRRGAEAGSTALAASMKAERESRIVDAKRRLSQAHADGDAEAIAAATADLGQAQAELVQIAARTPAAKPEGERQPAPQPQQQQRNPNLHPNAQAWIDRNPWFNKDQAKTSTAMSIHYALAAEGIGPDSDRYTKELDKRMQKAYPDDDELDSGSSDGGGRSTPRRTNAVAEGSRDNGAGRQPNPRTVELTSSQLAIAKQLNLTPQQYAASLIKYNNAANRKGA